jgi:hypothetical protein
MYIAAGSARWAGLSRPTWALGALALFDLLQLLQMVKITAADAADAADAQSFGLARIFHDFAADSIT